MDASEAGHVADVLAQNAAATNAAVADTGEAMKYIAPLANTVGLEFEEVAASIGIRPTQGIKAPGRHDASRCPFPFSQTHRPDDRQDGRAGSFFL